MTLRSSFVITLAAASLVACAAESAQEEPVSVTDSAIVGNVMTDTAEVQADRLVFEKGTVPQILKTRITAYQKALAGGAKREAVENVIMAGDRQKDATDASGQIREGIGNPYGFVRRAVGFEERGDKTIVLTERVALDEAFQEFQAGRIVQVGTQDQGTGLSPKFDKELHYKIPVINMNGKELYRSGATSVKLKTAYVNLDTTIDLGADIAWFNLNKAHVVLDANIDSELSVEASLAGPLDKSFSKEVYRGSWPVGSIGPIPVTLGLVATVGCTIHADGLAKASAGVGLNVAVRGGVEYDKDNGGLKGVGDKPRFTPRTITPTLDIKGDASTRCYVRPEVSIMLFDALGPTVTPDIAAKLDATYPPLQATLTGELGLDVGGKMQIFGKNLGDVNFHLFTVDKQLWQYGH